MKKLIGNFLIACFIFLSAGLSRADVGVIIPLDSGRGIPDQNILSIHKMELEILIDNNYATVKVLQVFRNHTNRDQEGQFVFVIPSESEISDFAVWDNQVRIPGIILEKWKAREIYEQIVSTMRDPGLLETTDDEAAINTFRAKIFPIPAGGTKRLEMEYTQKLDISKLKTYFVFPMKPTVYPAQTCEDLKISIKIMSRHNIRDFKTYFSKYPLTVKSKTEDGITLEGEFKNTPLEENIAFEYLADIKDLQFDFLTYRSADRFIYNTDPFSGYKYKDENGYFFASLLYNLPPTAKVSKNREIVILLDLSLSMQWNQLEKAYEALEYFIKGLKQGDRFQVIIFNDEVKSWNSKPIPFSPERAQQALDFVKNSYLTGGTDLLGAFREGLKQIKDNPDINEPYIVIITDGQPTAKELRYKEITNEINKMNREWKIAGSGRNFLAHIYVYGVGDKTNTILLEKLIADSEGYFTWVSDTESAEFKLRSFLDMIGSDLVKGIKLVFEQGLGIDMVYPENEGMAFNGSAISYVGRYKTPSKNVSLTVTGKRGNDDVSRKITVDLPEKDIVHSHLPRMWARARVDKLLDLINFEGEKDDWIKEIIALSKQYKFVTPYTSFLAAPRSLLRPRVIKPGDPVLRVKTDPAIVSVVAQFPFGLVKDLRYIADEDIWEVRFLAPKDMRDGSYSCKLLLKDIGGNLYRGSKSFIIDSKPPKSIPATDKKVYKAGERIILNVKSDADTRRITARLGIGMPVELRYKTMINASTGELKIPDFMPSGKYPITVFSEDFAHNNSTSEIIIEIIGG